MDFPPFLRGGGCDSGALGLTSWQNVNYTHPTFCGVSCIQVHVSWGLHIQYNLPSHAVCLLTTLSVACQEQPSKLGSQFVPHPDVWCRSKPLIW